MAETKDSAPAADSTPEWTDELQSDLENLLTVGEECISENELKNLLLYCANANKRFNLYDGFEPSGRMHIAQGVFKAMNVNKCTSSNGHFIFWVADWFALMNDKMGGDLEKIKIVGNYLIEVWKAAGMNLENVTFQWASEEITHNAHIYWPKMLDVARKFNVTRIKKCCQIMGRLEGNLKAAQALYPLMQCTDIFFLKADVCQLGVDQRKVNMLAREYCVAAKIKRKPVILSHHMLYGLKAGQEKMSKSDPDSAVFMEDSEEDVRRKIMSAYCPSSKDSNLSIENISIDDTVDAGKESMHLVEDELKNPCLDYVKNIIFAPPNATFTSGAHIFTSFEDVREAFVTGKLSEIELKEGLITELNKLLSPVRNHFTNDARAKGLLDQVRQFKKDTLPLSKEMRRLDLVGLEKVSANSHVVFIPTPSTQPTLQSLMDVITQMKAAPSVDTPIVLYLPDWGSIVQNHLLSEVKALNAYYDVFVTALKAMASDLSFTVIKQSEAILLDPSMYWISVINVGRFFGLDQVMGSNMNDSDCVGKVVARLMKVADILALAPSSISISAFSDDDLVEASLIDSYFKACGVNVPVMLKKDAPSLLLYKRENEAHKTPNDEYYITDDPKVNGKSKMKKAFCEPGNTEFCPPISLANTFCLSEGNPLVVKRSEENGGDSTYSSLTEIEAAFTDGSLHPGDLKASLSLIMVDVLNRLNLELKKVSKNVKALKAIEKKMSKQKQKEGFK